MVAWLHRERAELLRFWSLRIIVVTGAFIAGMWFGQRHFNFWEAPLQILTVGISGFTVFFAMVIGWLVTTSDKTRLNRALSGVCLVALGKYSYGIYLFHQTFNAILNPMVFSPVTGWKKGESLVGSFVFTDIVLLLSLGAAFLSWYLWESQFLRLKRYFPLSGRVARPRAAIERSLFADGELPAKGANSDERVSSERESS
jgi:peptidoglycan/LPS O-acetylase OafA/YrhL